MKIKCHWKILRISQHGPYVTNVEVRNRIQRAIRRREDLTIYNYRRAGISGWSCTDMSPDHPAWQRLNWRGWQLKETMGRQRQRVHGQDRTFQTYRGLCCGKQTEMEAAGGEIIGDDPGPSRVKGQRDSEREIVIVSTMDVLFVFSHISKLDLRGWESHNGSS